jgi:putative transposase
MIRYDPRDMAEVRVFYQERFLCRAVCPELAGETVPLRDVIRARNQRRQELRHTLRERSQMVDVLLEAHRGDQPREELPTHASAASAGEEAHHQETPKLKRYRHD